jgi:hypothetical protein
MDLNFDKTSPINRNELKDVDIDASLEGNTRNGGNTYTIDDVDEDNTYSNGTNNNYSTSTNGRYPSYATGDIPIENADIGSSLPSVDEIKASAALNNSGRNVTNDNDGAAGDVVIGKSDDDMDAYDDFTATPTQSTKNRRRFKYLVCSLVCIFLVALVIGVVLSIRGRRNGSNSSGGSNEPRKVDVETLRSYLSKNYNIQFNIPSDGTGASSAHYQAAAWMANIDQANMKLPKSLPIPDKDKLDQVYAYRYLSRYVLALFYYSTGGVSSWLNKLDFLSEQDICNWKGRVFTRYDIFRWDQLFTRSK